MQQTNERWIGRCDVIIWFVEGDSLVFWSLENCLCKNANFDSVFLENQQQQQQCQMW